MARKKQDNRILLGLISATALIIAYFFGGPLSDSMRDDRPILYVSFGDGTTLPKNQLQTDGQNYYVDIILANKGKTDGKFTLNAIGNNARLSFYKNGPFQENSIYNVLMYANSTSKGFVKIYVLPDMDKFSINLMVQPQAGVNLFQELTPLSPLVLTYQKSENDYLLTDAR